MFTIESNASLSAKKRKMPKCFCPKLVRMNRKRREEELSGLHLSLDWWKFLEGHTDVEAMRFVVY